MKSPLILLAALSLSACGPAPVPTPAPAAPAASAAPAPAPAAAGKLEFPLANLDEWKTIENGVTGAVTAKDGVMRLGAGDGLTGVVYQGKQPLPVKDYELAWEARLIDGVDFFAAATFPARDLKTCGTFLNGGWGGGVTGVSSLDGLAANENNTTTNVVYQKDQWYKFRIQVTAEMLVAYVDDRKVVNANITEKKVSLRSGDVELCAPLGFASYQTKGEIRNISIRPLRPGEVPLDPDAY